MKLIRNAASITGAVALTAGLLPMVTAPAAQAEPMNSCSTADFLSGRLAYVICRPELVEPERSGNGTVLEGSELKVLYGARSNHPGQTSELFTTVYTMVYDVHGFVDAREECVKPRLDYADFTNANIRDLGNGMVLTKRKSSTRDIVGSPADDGQYQWNASYETGGKAGQKLCAWTGVANREDGDFIDSSGLVFDSVRLSPLLEVVIGGAPTLPAPYPKDVELISESGGPATVGSRVTIRAAIRSGLGRSLISRDLTYGFVPQRGDRCVDWADSDAWNLNLTRVGTSTFEGPFYVFPEYAGQWMCAYQTVLGVNGEVYKSRTTYLKIEGPDAGAPKLNLPSINITPLFDQLKSATDALRVVVNQPEPDQAAIEQARAAAEAARQAAEAALQQAGINAQNAGNAGGAGNAQNAGNAAAPTAQAVLEELDRTEELIARSEGTVTPRSGLQVATGFDATVTPLLPIGSRTASGMVLDVKSPTTAKKKKAFKVTASVDPSNIRGRMRMFLLYMDGPTPKLVHKRSGFIGNQKKKTKKFYINKKDKKGNYVILTSFDPTTPGQVGVATLTPLVVK